MQPLSLPLSVPRLAGTVSLFCDLLFDLCTTTSRVGLLRGIKDGIIQFTCNMPAVIPTAPSMINLFNIYLFYNSKF